MGLGLTNCSLSTATNPESVSGTAGISPHKTLIFYFLFLFIYLFIIITIIIILIMNTSQILNVKFKSIYSDMKIIKDGGLVQAEWYAYHYQNVNNKKRIIIIMCYGR